MGYLETGFFYSIVRWNAKVDILDNFSVHRSVVDNNEYQLTNIRIAWLPPNCTYITLSTSGYGNRECSENPIQKVLT